MIQKLMRPIQHSSRFIMLALIAILLLGGGGCKSKKKAMEASNAAAEKARLEQEAKLREQREEEERRRQAEAEEQARRAAEAKKSEPRTRLEQYFAAIANANSVASANSSINEALSLFTSPDTPVLIVIHESADGQKDYDRPTTIKDYLNYLKDQKKSINQISDLQFDSSGKITSVELLKHN